MALLALSVGCGSSDDGEVTGPTDDPTYTVPPGTWVTPTGTATPTTPTTPTLPTTTGLDCSVPPPPPTGWDTLSNNIPRSEEFAFDATGHLFNIDDTANYLFQSTEDGSSVLALAPYTSAEVGAVRFMMDGNLVVADEGNGALKSLSKQGSIDVLIGSIPEPNSIAVHPNGWVYSTAMDQLWRYDPNNDTASQEWVLPGTDLDGLVFTNDYQWLYFNHDEDGIVGKSRVNADGSLQSPQILVNLVEGDAELDGMAMDACDNLYVLFTDGRITRLINDTITEDWIELVDWGGLWTTSLHFGSGYGGFERDHLYVMNRSGEIFDIEAGIIGKPEPHLYAPTFTTTTSTTTTSTGSTTMTTTGTTTTSTGAGTTTGSPTSSGGTTTSTLPPSGGSGLGGTG